MASKTDSQFTDPKEIEALIAEFERKLDRLKILYEQYFMGIEKREPTVPLKDVVRVMRRLDSEQIRNTALRYRFRSLVQRYNSYRTYWNRTLRQMEQGTYHRHLARMRRKMARDGIEMPKLGQMRSVGSVERALAEAKQAAGKQRKSAAPESPAAGIRGASADELRQRLLAEQGAAAGAASPQPAAPAASVPPAVGPGQPPPPPRPAAPAARSGGGPSDNEIQSLYRRFVRAKQMCGEDTSNIRVDALKRSISQQMPKLQQMYKGRDVEFQVVIRSGRAILKAKPK